MQTCYQEWLLAFGRNENVFWSRSDSQLQANNLNLKEEEEKKITAELFMFY